MAWTFEIVFGLLRHSSPEIKKTFLDFWSGFWTFHRLKVQKWTFALKQHFEVIINLKNKMNIHKNKGNICFDELKFLNLQHENKCEL